MSLEKGSVSFGELKARKEEVFFRAKNDSFRWDGTRLYILSEGGKERLSTIVLDDSTRVAVISREHFHSTFKERHNANPDSTLRESIRIRYD